MALAQEKFVNLCSNEEYGNIPNPAPAPDAVAPDSFIVTIGTNCSIGTGVNLVYEPITLAVYRNWAPLGGVCVCVCVDLCVCVCVCLRCAYGYALLL